MPFTLRPFDISAEIDPNIPNDRLVDVARGLDRLASTAMNSGLHLWAVKASRRAAELRELAGVTR